MITVVVFYVCQAGQVLLCIPNAAERKSLDKKFYAGFPMAPFFQPYDWINEQYGSENCLLAYLAAVSSLMPYVDAVECP